MLDAKEVLSKVRCDHFVDGEYVKSYGTKEETLLNPANNEPIATFKLGNAKDINHAVSIASAAFHNGPWRHMEIEERAQILYKMAGLINDNSEFLAMLESLNVGKLYKACLHGDVPRAAENFKFFTTPRWRHMTERYRMGSNFLGRSIDAESIVDREPLGVCGIIKPWNSPLMLASWYLAPCLLMGNTCVIKPSPWAPLSIMQLGEIANEAGLPSGVLNIVPGGADAGQALVKNQDVRGIVFTGGDKIGRSIQIENAQVRRKGPHLELGGKAPTIVFDDADMNLAVEGVAHGIFRSQGQSCIAGSRLLVEEKIYPEFMRRLVEYVKTLKISDQFDPAAHIGPLINRTHLQRVEDYIKSGIKEGARLVCGGKRPQGENLDRGNFLEPTIFEVNKPSIKIYREEIFGPVLTTRSFKTVEQAVLMANDTDYGLSANIWTEDLEKAKRVAKALDVGMVWVNCYFVRDLNTPFGGRKCSGNGSAGGRYILEYFSQPKMTCIAHYSK